jgi:hypothetical protein
MPILENTPQRLVLQSGSTILTLDKGAGTGCLQRKMLFWKLKPREHRLTDFTDVTVDAAVDRASGVEVCHTMLITQAGEGWALPAADKKDAEATSATVRGFLGIS